MAAPNTRPRIFVSHSHADNAFCHDYVIGLREHGLDVWFDEHNLGWGALRSTIEREMPLCQHFVAVLSPASVASEWVNAEIDAALELLKNGSLQTLTFVVAVPCTTPLLLRRWKRIEGADGAAVGVAEAVAGTMSIVAPPPLPTSHTAVPPVSPTPPYQIPGNHLLARLEQLGFAAQQASGVEFIVPPLCDIPAGSCLIGTDPKRDPVASNETWAEREKPQHTVWLTAYQIARYPVTVAEYACFVRTGQRQPNDWQQQLGKLDHPVVNVSWYDAVAYASWLTERTGHPWRLPTEIEWEKAARGADGRVYPWGDAWDPSRANTREGERRGTTPIDAYVSGASPFGVQDLSGNVWEWTSSLYEPYPYTAGNGRDLPTPTALCVLRGGSWGSSSVGARAAFRLDRRPDVLNGDLGFR
ncbi:MAG: SUMF1/EgtB/PvdO family nonheme iron enzyme, partial [Ktedonobacterales bacterium]